MEFQKLVEKYEKKKDEIRQLQAYIDEYFTEYDNDEYCAEDIQLEWQEQDRQEYDNAQIKIEFMKEELDKIVKLIQEYSLNHPKEPLPLKWKGH